MIQKESTVKSGQTQYDTVEFCALHKIRPEITKFPPTGIDLAWEEVVARKARYRFVIDMKA